MIKMVAKVTEESENIIMQELLIQEAWCGWEESLRMTNRI